MIHTSMVWNDATSLATFQSNQESIARVDGNGVFTAGQLPGSAAVMASYLGHVALYFNSPDQSLLAGAIKVSGPPPQLPDQRVILTFEPSSDKG